ncbi:MAG TPA: hypothetical protein VE377_00360 [Candidatus Dormibacteraeota bacterium]|nr:hypothetical protein [Candidatus Dormibacteraeota bacterium]
MTILRSLSIGSLLVSLIIATGCGSSRQLQSVTLSPPAADAKNFPNGQVPFVANGVFSGSSTPVPLTSKDITWCYGGPANLANPTAGICAGNIAQLATVDQNGVAQCTAQFQGSVIILAGTPTMTMMPDAGPQLRVFGSATLTCP